jgi:hypothetical protein
MPGQELESIDVDPPKRSLREPVRASRRRPEAFRPPLPMLECTPLTAWHHGQVCGSTRAGGPGFQREGRRWAPRPFDRLSRSMTVLTDRGPLVELRQFFRALDQDSLTAIESAPEADLLAARELWLLGLGESLVPFLSKRPRMRMHQRIAYWSATVMWVERMRELMPEMIEMLGDRDTLS